MRHFAPEAARQAAALGAHREAAAHYRTALDHAPADDLEARATLSEGRAYECYLVNQFDDAVEARETALDLRRQQDDLPKVGDNLSWLSRLAFIRGRGQDARKLATEAVQILERLPPGPELAMAYSAMSQLHMLAEDGPAAVEWGQRALRIAEPLGLTETVVHALNNVGTAELLVGDPAGRAKLERSLELALAHGMHEHAGRAYINLAYQALVVRDYDRVQQLLTDGIAYARERDLDSWTLYALTERSRAHLEQGLWREAEEDASAVLRAAPAAITRFVAVLVLGCVRMRRGDQGAGPLLDEARERAWATGDIMRIGRWRPPVSRRPGSRATSRGRATMSPMPTSWPCATRSPGGWGSWPVALARRRARPTVREHGAALSAGDWWRLAGGRRCLAAAEVSLRGSPGPGARQPAGAAAGAGHPDRAGRRPGSRDDPARPACRGCSWYSRGPRTATRHNPLGLTERQLAILRLLAEGLSNKEIAARLRIAPKTVDHHVCAVLAKLEVSTRKQAARHAVARLAREI